MLLLLLTPVARFCDAPAMGLGVLLVLRARPAAEPKTPVGIVLDQRTRKERIWLSRRHRGLARRSRNSLTLTPVSKR